MRVRAKLFVSQMLNVVLVVGVSIAAVLAAREFESESRRAKLAFEQQQLVTMLVAQTYRYRALTHEIVYGIGASSAALAVARRDVEATLQQLRDRTREEFEFLAPTERQDEVEEFERVEQLAQNMRAIDAMVRRLDESRKTGKLEDPGRQLELVDGEFQRLIAVPLAGALADEHGEVTETDEEIAELMNRRLALLGVAGLIALAISTFTGVTLYRFISRPVQQLQSGARALASGDLRHRVSVSGSGEFAELANQFNAMAEQLEDRERHLLSAQSELKGEVSRRTADLETANRRLKYLDRQRLLFLADISHELRTPVTILRGDAEVTLRGPSKSDEQYRQALGRIIDQSKQLGRLIDDLMFLARSESDTIAFDMDKIDVREIVMEAAREGNLLARGREITVRESVPEESVWVRADRQRLRQALLIAVDNAIKHSDTRGVVELAVVPRDGRAEISVLDYGAGIKADEMPFVFERFRRGSREPGVNREGSGLGLAIAKWIAEKHNGSIALESKPGVETRLTIELPTLEVETP